MKYTDNKGNVHEGKCIFATVVPDVRYEETTRKNNPVPKRAAEQPHEARKGRVAKARRKMHGSSVDTAGDNWVNTANSE